MFRGKDIEPLKESSYEIVLFNCHDVTLHSNRTGHDWIIVSDYGHESCYILHRHSQRDSYHRQRGRYNNLEGALKYIEGHERWFVGKRQYYNRLAK